MKKANEIVTKHSGKLSIKFMVILLIMIIMVYFGAIIVGHQLYDVSIKEYYNTMAYNAATVASTYFRDDELPRYAKAAYGYNTGSVDASEIEAIKAEPRYNEMLMELANLSDSIGANDVFVVTINMDVMKAYTDESAANKTWQPLYYIADVYTDPSLNYKLGDTGGILKQYRLDVEDSYETGKKHDGFFISKSEFGYNLTAMLPIVKDGKTIAMVGVEIPMSTLASNKAKFVVRVSIITAIVALLCLIGGIILLTNSVIAPIQMVSAEANDFVKNNTKISEKLTSVKTGDEIQTLSESVYKMEVGINEYIDNLQKVTAEKERIGAELNVATQIQADMLPRIFPPFPERKEIDIFASMDPAKEVGGDFYDFFLIDDDHIGLVMADVSGKGVPAALFMVIAKTLIKNRALMGGSPSEVLAYANDQLCEGNEAELFVTVWFGILQISTGKGLAANAGHEHPVIKRKDGQFELVVYRHSPAVASIAGIPFKQHEFEMNPGDTLFVYTDGVAEATDAHDTLYGTDRMLEALNSASDAPVEQLVTNVRASIDEFVGDAPQFDDITMLAFKYNGIAENKDA
ncbi:MAG: PP2C family protein-serine/threonine phosphatase [Lachnospiraceae bacterium]|nr:PP2C family protein-serine/threonine phosphatase [Lachnospiraceae bacterium]